MEIVRRVSGTNRTRRAGRRTLSLVTVSVLVLVMSAVYAGPASATPQPDGWGTNPYGQLTSLPNPQTSPTPMVGWPSGVTKISSGDFHTLALAGGHVWATGDNTYGELGDNSTTSSTAPVEVLCGAAPSGFCSGGHLAKVKAIFAGFGWSLAIIGTSVVAWGYDGEGQLGNGLLTNAPTPVRVCAAGLPNNTPCPTGPYLTRVKAISAGDVGSLARVGSKVVAWGNNGSGDLGNGSLTNESVPVAVCAIGQTSCTLTHDELIQVKAIAEGDTHSLAVVKGGRIDSWGSNFDGELGNGPCAGCSSCPSYTLGQIGLVTPVGPCSTVTLPVCAVGGCTNGVVSGATAISGGYSDSMALLHNTGGPEVAMWGANPYGELGDGTTVNANAPVGVCPVAPLNANNVTCGSGPYLTGVTAINAGDIHSLVIVSGGDVDSWGANIVGELGTAPGSPEISCPGVGPPYGPGPAFCQNDPAPIAGLSSVKAISGDDVDSMAIF